MTTVYLVVEPDKIFPEDWRGTALTADGRELATALYLEGEEDKARRRVGNAHGLYRRSCPEGYKLVWKEEDPAGYAEARRRYEELWEAARPEREAETACIIEERRERLRRERETISVPMDVESELEALRRMTETEWSKDEEEDD